MIEMHDTHNSSWICCQIGAREHYAIPSALHSCQLLYSLLTDLWLPPNHPALMAMGKRGAGRFNSNLESARVWSSNTKTLADSLRSKLTQSTGWAHIIKRNMAFQSSAAKQLEKIHKENPNKSFILFSYSYAAKQLFQFAKSVGWTTVLGQIDPGPIEERIVLSLHQSQAIPNTSFLPAPPSYWDEWREECDLSDYIVVNSMWSRKALEQTGISAEKIRRVPLVFQPDPATSLFERTYPAYFSTERPLRLLFLGQAGLRKGIHLILQAAEQLCGDPVRIDIVGPIQVELSNDLLNHPILRWCGAVARSDVAGHYTNADAFLFPTFSDGFGLTQLEAQAWKLPLLVSRNCGEVVEQGFNGLIIDPLNADSIVKSIRSLLRNPNQLSLMSGRSELKTEHRTGGLVERLQAVIKPYLENK